MSKHQWHVELMNGDNFYVKADEVTVYASGSLVFSSEVDGMDLIMLAIAHDHWLMVRDSSLITENVIPKSKPVKPKVDDETRILQYLTRRGGSTIREVAQRVYGLTTAQVRTIVERLVNEKTLQESRIGKTVRFSLTEVAHD